MTRFAERARHEGERYGHDPYIFLRELAQNARDAGARSITIHTGNDAEQQWISIADDGAGMRFADAKAYLFRLYASSKESEPDNAGQFGVGFWSVLRWAPELLHIESATRHGEAWAIELSGDLQRYRHVPVTTNACGTRIRLQRPYAEAPETLRGAVRAAVQQHCPHLRQAGRRLDRVAIWCDGERLDRAVALPGEIATTFRARGLEGAVGLQPEPRVALYSRGLLVQEAVTADELFSGRRPKVDARRFAGLAPVMLIDSATIDLVLSRRQAVDNAALRRAVRRAQRELDRLVRRMVGGTHRLGWWRRVADGARAGVKAVGGWPWVATAASAAAVTLVAVWSLARLDVGDDWAARLRLAKPVREVRNATRGSDVASQGRRAGVGGSKPGGVPVTGPPQELPPAAALSEAAGATAGDDAWPTPADPAPAKPIAAAAPPSSSARRNRALYRGVTHYSGPSVQAQQAFGSSIAATVRGADNLHLRVAVAGAYDRERGWYAPPPSAAAPVPQRHCKANCIAIGLPVELQRQPTRLPLPRGYALVPNSVQLLRQTAPADAKHTLQLRRSSAGQPLVWAPRPIRGVLRYRVAPKRARSPRDAGAPRVHARAVGRLSPRLRALVQRWRRLPPKQRVARVLGSVRARFRYDVSRPVATSLAKDAAAVDWLHRAVSVGAGDCDVHNGVAVALLRHVGIPARLVLGLVLPSSRGGAVFHAWTEYFLGGWRQADATAPRGQRRRGVDRAAAAPQHRRATAANRTARSATGTPPDGAAALGRAPPLAQRPAAPQPAAERELARERQPLHAVQPATSGALWLFAGLGGLGLLVGLGWRWWTRRVRQPPVGSPEAVGAILTSAFVAPELWQSVPALWRQRVLPTIAGPPISVAEAIRRDRAGTLWLTRTHPPLALAAARHGNVVLDGALPAFADAIAALGRGRSLDLVAGALPLCTADALPTTQPAAPLLRAMQQVFATAGIPITVAAACASGSEPGWELDLRSLRGARRLGCPRRAWLANLEHAWTRKVAAAYQQDPARAVITFVDVALEHMGLLTGEAERVRLAAGRLLLAAHPEGMSQ